MRTLSAALLLIVVMPPGTLVAQSNGNDLFQEQHQRVNEFQNQSRARMQRMVDQSDAQFESMRNKANEPVSSYSSDSSSGGVRVSRIFRRRTLRGLLIILGVICAGTWKLLNRGPTKAPPPPIKL